MMAMTDNPTRQALEQAGWTAADLMELMGWSKQLTNKYWNGHRRWTGDRLVELLARLEDRDVRGELIERVARAAEAS